MPGLFDYREERALAAELVKMIEAQLPASSLSSEDGGSLSVNKITRLLERVYLEAVRRLHGRKLGVIRRSVFANAFKWGLSERGYASNFVDIATEGLVMEMTKSHKR